MAAQVEVNRSPWLILKAGWRLAGLSMRAVFALLVSLSAYGLGLTLVLTALAKPIWPHNVGLWMIRDGPTLDDVMVSLGRADHTQGRELLGWWLIRWPSSRAVSCSSGPGATA